MQIQLWEETVLRSATAALWSMTFHTADRENGYGETVFVKTVVGEAARRNLFSGEPNRGVARRSARSVGVGECSFMPQS